jgi:hypothetical protein
MGVEKAEKEDNLPQMVRDYILHDRGNSIYLGDSFGNLPSPVNEGATIKKLFKFYDEDPMEKKRKNETKNQAIRIEGKKEKNEEKKKSPERQLSADIRKMQLTEIEKIVFQQKKVINVSQNKKAASKRSGNDTKLSFKPYEEEESYENPVNLSKMPGLAENYMDIKSNYAPHPGTSISISKGFVNIENLELDVSLEHDPKDLKEIKIGLSSDETVRMPKKPKSKADS